MAASPASTASSTPLAWLIAAKPKRPRHDGDMARRAALLEHQPAQALAVVIEQLRRAHGAGDEDGVLRQISGRRRPRPAREQAQQPIGEVVDVVQPLARIRIGLPQHARAGVVAHPLHGGFGGQPGEQRLIETPAPAAVMREHAEGFQHLAMLAGALQIARSEHAVDHAGQVLDGLREPPLLELDILGDQLGDDDARLMQHHMAERHAFGDGNAGEAGALVAARILRCFVAHDQPARGDHLGDHHGSGLQRLDLLVAVMTLGAVLHRQYADGVTAAEDRHAEEGVVDLLAGFRPVGEGRVDLRVGELHRLGLLGDQADETFAALQMRGCARPRG